MTPIEADIIELLRSNGPCCLDDVVSCLPRLIWGEVFGAIDRMSRDRRVLVRPTLHGLVAKYLIERE
jgi:hypothetical protein